MTPVKILTVRVKLPPKRNPTRHSALLRQHSQTNCPTPSDHKKLSLQPISRLIDQSVDAEPRGGAAWTARTQISPRRGCRLDGTNARTARTQISRRGGAAWMARTQGQHERRLVREEGAAWTARTQGQHERRLVRGGVPHG